jgi:hypothetical protein
VVESISSGLRFRLLFPFLGGWQVKMLSSGVRIEAPILSGRLKFASNPRMQGASEISRSGPPPSELRPSRVESCVRLPPQGKKMVACRDEPRLHFEPNDHRCPIITCCHCRASGCCSLAFISMAASCCLFLGSEQRKTKEERMQEQQG